MSARAVQADSALLAYLGSKPGAARDSSAWFTPSPYVEAARRVMGGISLDPFSSPEANAVVRADRFYTEDNDALTQEWAAPSLWMNPPYAGRAVAAAMDAFMDRFAARQFAVGIVLVNNCTETRWHQRALREGSAFCLTDHRIAFWNADGKRQSGNTRGQTFFLFGDDYVEAFGAEFAQFGAVLDTRGGGGDVG